MPGMNNTFKTVALIGKYKSLEIAGHLQRLARFLSDRGITVLVDRLTAVHLENSAFPVLALEEIGKRANLAIVIGGDGTMLNIARTFAPHNVALVGVNQGRLGFLTDISVDTMLETIGTILDGKYVTEERMLLSAEIFSNNQSVLKVLVFFGPQVFQAFLRRPQAPLLQSLVAALNINRDQRKTF